MKKLSKFYLAIWIVLVVVFNVLAFVIPGWNGFDKFNTTFFIGYGLIMSTLVGQLVVALINLNKKQDKNITFLKLPLINVTIGSLVLSAIIGIVCSIFTFIPIWIAVVISTLALAVMIIAFIRVEATATIITNTNEKVRKKTAFIDTLSIKAESLWGLAQGEEIKKLAKKVWEAIRYSDTVSSDDLADIEKELLDNFEAFANAVKLSNIKEVKSLADLVISTANTRNKMCKLVK